MIPLNQEFARPGDSYLRAFFLQGYGLVIIAFAL